MSKKRVIITDCRPEPGAGPPSDPCVLPDDFTYFCALRVFWSLYGGKYAKNTPSSWDMLLHRQPTTLSGARFALAMALTPFELAMKSHDRNICDCGVLCVYTVLGNDTCSHFWLQLLLN